MPRPGDKNGVLSASERSDLTRLIRQRERVAKTEVRSRRARLKADAELEMNSIFAAEDALWNDLVALAQEGMRKINAQLAARAREVGIPKAMGHPRLELGWSTVGS